MEQKHWWMLGGVVVLIIFFVVAFGTNPAALSQGTGNRYGPGQGSGAGTGSGTGTAEGSPALLPRTDTTPLSDRETAWILFMREEEQLAYDEYTRWAAKYPVRVFSTIAASETMHISEVQLLIDRYGLARHRIGNASAGYSDPVIRSLYTTLTKQGDTSQTGALEAGLAIEERDIADLDMALANTTRADVIQVYSNLRRGSENHKSAFLRQLGR